MRSADPLPEGFIAVVKQDCPTCRLVAPAFIELVAAGVPLTVFSQDDALFPPGLPVADDTSLEMSFRLGIEVVPTLLRVSGGEVVARTEGWRREEWRRLTAVPGPVSYTHLRAHET